MDVLNTQHVQSMSAAEQITQLEWLRDRAEDQIRGLTIAPDQLLRLGRANLVILHSSPLEITAPQSGVAQYVALVRLTARINSIIHDLS